MAKQIILILLLSLAAILFRNKLALVLDGVIYAHNEIGKFLHVIFAEDQAGRLIQDMIALLFIPAVIGTIASVAFYMVKHMPLPQVMVVVWVVWLILLVTMVLQSGHPQQPKHAMQILTAPMHAPMPVSP